MPRRLAAFDWGDMKYFLAVARAGTIRAAAEVIGANHATVSRRLAALETAIDARLFDRARSGLTLTQLGEDLYPRALRIEEEIAAASRGVAGRDTRPAGAINLTIPPFMAVTSIMDDLAQFCARFEDINIHLEVTNTIASLERREADVSIRYAFEVTDDVVGRRLVRCSKAVYCSKSYALRIRDNGGAGLEWIGWTEEAGIATAPWVKKSAYPHATIRHRVNEAIPQAKLAAHGVGLVLLPCFVGDTWPGIVRAPFQTPIPDRSIWLLLHRDLRKTARIRMFVDFLADRITKRKAEFTGKTGGT
ncbi:MAG: LysR family transcriptional regulator [Alphaproteobacteria bacterium]|nr:LysR family transcriptional regulator [Alphaproteobacteria bacterium]